MFSHDSDALVPRNGQVLRVLITARISGCQNQKEMSLDDQIDHAKEIVADMYDGLVDYKVFATKAKGELLERPELAEIETAIRSRTFDLFVMEDIGRLVRGVEAVWILGIGVDHGTRGISPNDGVDTIEPTWEEDALAACRDHVSHNIHTSKRIKFKLMNRFSKFGGAIPCEIAGYIVPDNAKFFDDWQKDEQATSIIQQGLKILRETLNCSAVADYFNSVGFQRGPYAKRKEWLGSDVRDFYKNRLLGGYPGRGYKHSVKHHESGRRICAKNPKGPKFRECLHLAHVDIVELDEVNRLLAEKNKNFRRTNNNPIDPRLHVLRKRTRYPGQHAGCWYCGRTMVWGASGAATGLMCSGAREWLCWNSAGFNGELAAKKTVELIIAQLSELDGFHDQFVELVQIANRQAVGDPENRWQRLRQGESNLEEQRNNVIAGIAAYGPRPEFQSKLNELDGLARQLGDERLALERLRERRLVLPDSPAAIQEQMQQAFQRLAIDSPEFGDLLRPIVPQFYVYLVRLIDGGKLLPRAFVEVNLAGDYPDVPMAADLHRLVTKQCTLDLFEPSLRERIRARAVALRAENPKITLDEIANRLPEKPSAPVVGQALQLHALMQASNLSSPYVLITEPPEDFTKLRKHKNPRYRFQPRPGYQRPELP